MKILVVCSVNKGYVAPFIVDQVEALRANGIAVDYFLIQGKGVFGYLKNLPKLVEKIKDYKPQYVHAHYGFSGLLATLQRKVKVVLTLHGSDVNTFKNRIVSYVGAVRAKRVIVVNPSMKGRLPFVKSIIIPCGVDTGIFKPIKVSVSKNSADINILFSSSFDNRVKNYPLTEQAVQSIKEFHINIIELKGLKRNEVAELMNKVDVCVLSSYSEGSPQFIKEAMACNRPIVSTKVGDVEWLLKDVEGTYISENNVADFSKNLKQAIKFSFEKQNTNARERLLELALDEQSVTQKIIETYQAIAV